MSLVRRSIGLAVTLATFAAVGDAQAGNGIHPRTPVEWQDSNPACMTVVDRSVSSVLEMSYTILYEDLRPAVTEDEVADSRRHQFLAFCRGHSVQEPLPVWLSTADVEAAAELMLVKPETLAPEDILDDSPEWQDCFFRITGDDERRLITFAEAAKPVVWDTAQLPIGAYTVYGYTWEPPFNIYSLRPGLVKVVDDPDPAANPPALAIVDTDDIAFGDEELIVRGCIDAMDGSTITGYWSGTKGDALDWQPFASDVPVAGPDFELPFLPPAEAVGGSVTLKVEITDPMDRTFTGHMDSLVEILPANPNTGGCDSEGNSFIGDPGCGTATDTDAATTGTAPDPTTGAGTDAATGAGTDASSSGEPPGVTEPTGPDINPEKDGGCAGCATSSEPVAPLALLGLFLALRRRRRPRA